MKRKAAVCVLLVGWMLGACTGDFDDINTDPNATSKASSALLATTVTGNLIKWDLWISVANDGMRSKIICDTEGAQAAQYNLLGRGTFEGYNLLVTADKMVENANPAFVDAYRGLALFFKAFKMYYTTMQMGDIPYSEAALAEKEGVIKPGYDAQKEVFRQILDDLDAANSYFAAATAPFSGDVCFDGDPKKWQRVTNSFALKVLIALSKRADDTPELNVKGRFAEVASRPLLESGDDNLRFECRNQPGMYPPYYRISNQSWMYLRMSSVMLDILKKHGDYRLFYYAEPSEYWQAQGISVSDTACYPGINPAWNNTDIERLTGERKTCRINARYLDDPSGGEPIARVGFAQQEFILAEGALRGWLPGQTASQHYLKGIEAGLRFTAAHTPDDPLFHHNRQITDAYIAQHLRKASLQLSENPADFDADLQKIIEQKFAASFLQYKYDPFYDNRRTGWPVYPIDPATNQNELVDRMPIRWMYPMEEATQNTEHYQEALDRQFNGIDDHNVHMWLTK
ncbi:MAG: SusD/RagB family nutrient-binding outer membrane lipoprotein [Tannerella sp.]|nr:SusD/RagB family nutrient-binding outer membrane lipoprotein [Tannerella sp.]